MRFSVKRRLIALMILALLLDGHVITISQAATRFQFAGLVSQDQVQPLPDAKVGVGYEHTFQAEGGLPPLKWAIAGAESES